MAIKVPANVLTMPRNEVAEFFITFARFEFALKASGFGENGRWGAEANWNRFADRIESCFNASTTEELRTAVEYLMTKPPKRQHYAHKALGWRSRTPFPDSSCMRKLLFHVRGVRNNLFHGAKFLERESDDPCRDAQLVSAASVVLAECLRIAPEVAELFYADP